MIDGSGGKYVLVAAVKSLGDWIVSVGDPAADSRASYDNFAQLQQDWAQPKLSKMINALYTRGTRPPGPGSMTFQDVLGVLKQIDNQNVWVEDEIVQTSQPGYPYIMLLEKSPNEVAIIESAQEASSVLNGGQWRSAADPDPE